MGFCPYHIYFAENSRLNLVIILKDYIKEKSTEEVILENINVDTLDCVSRNK